MAKVAVFCVNLLTILIIQKRTSTSPNIYTSPHKMSELVANC